MVRDPYDAVRLSLLPRIGGYRGRSLLQTLTDFDAIRAATVAELSRVEGIGISLARDLHGALRDGRTMHDIERTVARSRLLAERGGIRLCTMFDADFPHALRRLYDAPLYIFIRGEYRQEDRTAIAIVGTRTPTEYGRRATAHFARQCAEAGVTVVSGLAVGIDTIAHRTALQHGGRSIAVLGSGLLNIYPSVNRKLAERCAHSGCVLSELPLDAKPDAGNFPRRNRIVSGLSLGVIVTESDIRGGAIITAGLALDQNRDVFAVPGPIFDAKSGGPNALIKRGVAHPVEGFEDIVEHLPTLNGARVRDRRAGVQLSFVEESILSRLSGEPLHIDELAAGTGLAHSDLLVLLLQLEFKNVVRQLPGKYFVTDP